MNGEDTILLTAREHFLCHWLLCKMVEGEKKYKMYNAFAFMSAISENQKRKYTSKQYEIIKKYRSLTTKGRKLSEEHKRKCSKALRGEKHPMFGKTHTDETKKKISKSHIGIKPSKEARQKMSLAGKRRKHSEETKQKMSLFAKGKPKSEETKKKISLTKKRINLARHQGGDVFQSLV